MLKTVVALIAFLAWVPVLHADDYAPFKYKLKIFVDATDFYWDEHYGGEKLLREDGWLFGTGVTFKNISPKRGEDDPYRLTYGGSLRIFFGQVDYDGRTQPPQSIPVQTNVDYSGLNLEGRFGVLFKTSRDWLFVEPHVGLGFSPWSRDLQSTDIAAGYTEFWINIHGRAGLAFAMPFKPDHLLSAGCGILLPLWVRNSIHIWDSINLEPEAFHPTPYANLAYEYKRFGVEIFFDSYRFGESPRVLRGSYYYLQPESYTYNLGMRLTYAIF